MVVGEARHDDREARRQHGERRDDHAIVPSSHPGGQRPGSSPVAREARGARTNAAAPSPAASASAIIDAAGRSVSSPASGQVTDRSADHRYAARGSPAPPAAAAGQVAEDRARLREVAASARGSRAAHTRARGSASDPAPARSSGPDGSPAARRRRSVQRPMPPPAARRRRRPATWSCIVNIAPAAASSHQRARPVRRAARAPANASAAANGIGLGFQMKVDSLIPAGETAARRPATTAASGPADQSREPPRRGDRADPEQRELHRSPRPGRRRTAAAAGASR